ncbi:hypothetical protein ACFLSW_06285 [Candidatus Bipolaricaulota bacterium]
MKRLMLVALLFSMVGSIAALANPPTETDWFVGTWVNASAEDVVCTDFEFYYPCDTCDWLDIRLTLSGVIPIEWVLGCSFMSDSPDSTIATHAVWHRAEPTESYGAYGTLEVLDDQLVMEIYFFNLAHNATDYYVKEYFNKQAEEATAED